MGKFVAKFIQAGSIVDIIRQVNENLRDLERSSGASGDGRSASSLQQSTGVSSHQQLSGRDLDGQHPIGAITGLRSELDSITPRVYSQSSASKVWGPIPNPFGRPCAVEIIDSGGNEIDAEVLHASDFSTVTLTFSALTSGKAVLT